MPCGSTPSSSWTRSASELVVAAALVVAAPGCLVEDVPTPGYAYGYEPQYYDGYVVYYDTVGHPYYYRSGAAVRIDVGSPRYGPLVRHWHSYRPAYRRWYTHRGYRYRGYHRR
jgi:hypothetical protein